MTQAPAPPVDAARDRADPSLHPLRPRGRAGGRRACASCATRSSFAAVRDPDARHRGASGSSRSSPCLPSLAGPRSPGTGRSSGRSPGSRRANGGLAVTLVVSNQGTKPAATTCRITETPAPIGGPAPASSRRRSSRRTRQIEVHDHADEVRHRPDRARRRLPDAVTARAGVRGPERRTSPSRRLASRAGVLLVERYREGRAASTSSRRRTSSPRSTTCPRR